MTNADLNETLKSIRKQVIAEGEEKLGSHQLDAHWSIAYACHQPPEAWEIYRVPSLHLMPSTEFYMSHAAEIQESLRPAATWELLRG
jgi:mRNA-degrading endonuclease YafQ of YafQ-DinJ toxin-antitoxin module